MIRKPDSREFREGAAVSAIRDASTLAVEGARGVGKGTANLLKWWLLLMMGFGFVMSLVSAAGAVGWLLLLGGGFAWYLSRQKKRHRRELAEATAPRREAPRVVDPALANANGRYDLSVAAVGRTAATMAAPAILLFPTSGMFSFMLPFTLVGIVYVALAIMIVARLYGDRNVLHYDGRALTVRGLLGETTILWEDVDDVVVRKTSIFNLFTLFTSGARQNVVVLGARNRLGGADRLLIPYPLLGLDREGVIKLVTELLMLRSGLPADVVHEARATGPTPAPAPKPVAAEPFDADAIMARYLAERDQLRATGGPASAAPQAPRTFGRKRVGM